MQREGDSRPPVGGSGGGFAQNFSGAALSKLLPIQ